MIQGIDHAVILVNDLDVAIANYTDLGFTVIPGGEHTMVRPTTHSSFLLSRGSGTAATWN